MTGMVSSSFSFSIWPPISRPQGQGAPRSTVACLSKGTNRDFFLSLLRIQRTPKDDSTQLPFSTDNTISSLIQVILQEYMAVLQDRQQETASAPRRYLTDQPIHPHIRLTTVIRIHIFIPGERSTRYQSGVKAEVAFSCLMHATSFRNWCWMVMRSSGTVQVSVSTLSFTRIVIIQAWAFHPGSRCLSIFLRMNFLSWEARIARLRTMKENHPNSAGESAWRISRTPSTCIKQTSEPVPRPG
ncbi:hypothetical protein ARMSODRAFT_772387 [Armillaria solidipes]|uniref:Uncharacterized protein n=1 Tax=Armillaria solidipes TaxID=1076256 RepID=A0A2H3B165_9AGAR|nr:hypothetical protein ARMSODRAFT_772387 [Armillaria solidipes]